MRQLRFFMAVLESGNDLEYCVYFLLDIDENGAEIDVSGIHEMC